MTKVNTMTNAELLNIIKGVFVAWNCGEYNGKKYGDYMNEAREYDEMFPNFLAMELPEDWDDNRERWENEDYNWILVEWEYYAK